MAEDQGREHEDQRARRTETATEQSGAGPEGLLGQQEVPSYPASVLSDPRVSGRGNQPVQSAVLQRMQQSYGNRATQRFVQRNRASSHEKQNPLSEQIQAKAGGGNALAPDVQGQLEDGLGANMSGVRVHTDGDADAMAKSVDAVAFTTGNDIFFKEGTYNPGSTDGMRLLAHEATHTVQQSQGPVSGTPAPGGVSVSDPSDSFEQAAEKSADAVLSRKMVQREEAEDEQKKKPDDEDAPVQTMRAYAAIQRQEAPDAAEEEQKKEPEEDETVQTMRASLSIQRDADTDLVKAGKQVADNEAKDAKVQVIMGHTTTADENEAKSIMGQIDAAENMVKNHPKALIRSDGGLGPMKGIYAENIDAKFVLERYLATVSESGNQESEFAASYATTKRDHGEFIGMWSAFQAAGGKLDEGSQKGKMAELSKDPEFLRARGKFETARNDLVTDHNKIQEGQLQAEGAKEALTGAIFAARAKASNVKADKKQSELNAVMQSINDAVSTIMTVAKIASAAYTGVIAMGTGGLDMSKMVETSPEIAPPSGGGSTSTTPSLAPPDIKKFAAPGTDLNPNPAPSLPEEGHEKAGDTRTYSLPSQTADTVKSLGEKGAGLLGGPEAMLKSAITMLEQSNIDKIQGQIEAAKEEGNLNDAAAAAASLKEKRVAYQEKLTTLNNNVGNLLNHKKQIDTYVADMVAAAKKHGAGKDLTGGLHLVAAGDKFLSQVDLTIDLANRQQSKGNEARTQRYNINAEAFSGGTEQGPGQLHWWKVANDKGADDFVATKNRVELKASGKDSLVSDQARNSTQFDVGKSLEELNEWKKDVTAKRDQAQSSLGLGVAAGTSTK